MRTILNISYVGQAWGGFMSGYVSTTYPKADLTRDEALAVRDSLIETRAAKVEGKIEFVGFGGDFQTITDMVIEQRVVEFAETYTEDGRRITTETTTTEVLVDWTRPESESLMEGVE